MRNVISDIPKKDKEKKILVTVRINLRMKKLLKKIGHGNVSHAIRSILDKSLDLN
jgi:hypothetical protein